jgi:GNAT superfamily N-acetyltransferase
LSGASEPIVEPPTEADLDMLARMFHEDMTMLGVESTLEGKRELARRVLDASPEDRVCMVVRREPGGEACGVVLANFVFSIEFSGRCLWIEGLYVRPEHRRAGLGRVMVGALLDWAEAHGVPGVDIEAYHGNTPASVLYRTMGFRRLGRERFNLRL